MLLADKPEEKRREALVLCYAVWGALGLWATAQVAKKEWGRSSQWAWSGKKTGSRPKALNGYKKIGEKFYELWIEFFSYKL